MDLEDAAALSVCARCEKQRLERQHERIWLVASGRWCLAMRRSQQERLAASMCKEGARARAGTPCVLLTAARVSSITRHRAAVLRVMQGEARAAPTRTGTSGARESASVPATSKSCAVRGERES